MMIEETEKHLGGKMMGDRYIIMGAGRNSERAARFYGIEKVVFFVDNDIKKHGSSLLGKPIVSVDQMVKERKSEKIVIGTTKYRNEIERQLNDIGVLDYSYYRPECEKIINAMKNLSNKFFVVGIPDYVDDIAAMIKGSECGKYWKGICDFPNSDWVGRTIEGFPTISIDDCKGMDCTFFLVKEEFHLSYVLYLNTVCPKANIIDPFKKIGYYPESEIIINPYEYQKGAETEEEWNRTTPSEKLIASVDKYVDVAWRCRPLFKYLEIETVNRCNGSCSFCPVSKNNDKREYSEMSDALFERIIDQLHEMDYSGELCLFSNNEPLLDEKIVERNHYARLKLPNARMHLFTNGTLLTMDKFIALIEDLDELIIDNYSDDLQLHKRSRDIFEYVSDHKELSGKVSIVLRKANEILTSRGGEAPNRKSIVRYGENKCALPFEQMIIRPDGRVSLCCNDPLGKTTLGDLNSESITDIWYGEKYRAIRESLLDGRKNIPQCSRCDTFYLY